MVSDGAHYLTLGRSSSGEFREKGSRFLAFAFPIADEAAFTAERERIVQAHHSARHVCHAWVLEPDGSRFHAFDAGEPSGTAGQPILRQLQHAGLTYCAIVVARYFGGTLLGKPGLARAFTSAAKDALAANTIVRKQACTVLSVACSYADVEAIKHEVMRAGGSVLRADYHQHCTLEVALSDPQAQELAAEWQRQGVKVERISKLFLDASGSDRATR